MNLHFKSMCSLVFNSTHKSISALSNDTNLSPSTLLSTLLFEIENQFPQYMMINFKV